VSGPALDGALKPDFLAPVFRIAADVFVNDSRLTLPRNEPSTLLPPGYMISCCTSASSPYAAGVVALLLSAAKQEGLLYSVDTLGRALRTSAQFLPDVPAHQQGSGVLDVRAAWNALHDGVELPRIQIVGPISHVLADYSASGRFGSGLFEREGWTAGLRGRRVLELRRVSGPAQSIAYDVSWTGNDGTFATVDSIALPLNGSTPLPIEIAPRSPGVHSAILNLHDRATRAIVSRSAVTIVAGEIAINDTLRLTGSLSLMRSQAHYVSVPERVGAVTIELEVLSGSASAMILPSHGIVREYYGHVFPQGGRTFPKGTYVVTLPQPAPGTWSITVGNDSAWLESDRSLVSTEQAVYALTVRFQRSGMALRASATGAIVADVVNDGATIEDAQIDCALGTSRSFSSAFLPTGLPNRFTIDVPRETATLALDVRSTRPSGAQLELHLYDCSSGDCFSHDFTVPARPQQAMTVRDPKPGRWVAAVNSAPLPTISGEIALDEVIAGSSFRVPTTASGRHVTGDRWKATFELPADRRDRSTTLRVLRCELVDAAVQRRAIDQPWENRNGLTNFAQHSVAIATAILPLK
jgi:hypothetical protein